jgi:hypothetical protein
MSRLRELFKSGPAPVQPVPHVSAADIERVVYRDFPRAQVDDVLAILAEYGTEIWHKEKERVRLAALKLAGGDLGKLRTAIDRAKLDYRDVLAPAEYPRFMQQGLRFRRLRSRDRELIYTDDWQQYERWLKKGFSPKE